jgi:simple sugar transport system ATP-binding protein
VAKDVTLTIRARDIVGIAAVDGSGQHELLRALAGRRSPLRGTLNIPATIGFVPEDRHHDALVLEHTATDNIVLRGSGTRRGTVRWNDERRRTDRLMKDFDVRGNAQQPVSGLSGGNQQKLVVGRELEESPTLFVVENPTRGLDIRATRAVHDRLRDAAGAGAGVVVYSSDLDEVLALATRVTVMHAGRLHESNHDRETVGRAMLGIS